LLYCESSANRRCEHTTGRRGLTRRGARHAAIRWRFATVQRDVR